MYAAKTLGLNMLQFHRDLGKAEALDADDEGGLMRYMEPGGGQLSFADQGYNLTLPTPTQPPIDTSGNGGDAKTFSERYEEYRILYMVRDHRSHPSLMIYCVQNEDMPDLHNERIFRILREMHAEDPAARSFCIRATTPPSTRPFTCRTTTNRGSRPRSCRGLT